MPNTLAHFGFQGAANSMAGRWVPAHWFVAGCVIPDLPWILHRVLRVTILPVSPYDLRLYAIVQSSFFFCAVLTLALVLLLARRRWLAGGIVMGNVVLHLFLDGLQTKWGNGAQFLAPFDWSVWSIDLFWPESPVTVIATVAGAGYLWYLAGARPSPCVGVRLATDRSILLPSLGLMVAYVLGPLIFMSAAGREDNHYVATLRDRATRVGRSVEFDRVRFDPASPAPIITTFAGEELHLRGVDGHLPEGSGTVSIRGEFVARDTVAVRDIHHHHPWFREAGSVVGLSAGLLLWIAVLARSTEKGHSTPDRA